MTKNQIDYWNYVENARHNRATERLSSEQQRETNRANLAQESIQQRRNDINYRANVINAQHYSNMDSENRRSNMAREQETNRSNLVLEQETKRRNLANESFNYAGLVNAADIARISAGVGYANVAEQQRSNIAREQETNRSNLIYESIAARNSDANVSNAFSNAKNAETQSSKLGFERDKWSSIGLQSAQISAWAQQQDTRMKIARLDADLANLNSQTVANYSKAAESGTRALNNVLGLASKFSLGGKK